MRKFDLAKCRADVDFGVGLYTTTNDRQANDWAGRAARLFNRRHIHARVAAIPVVIKFSLDRNALAKLDTMFFVRPGADYWTLVRHCRQSGNHVRSTNSVWYDGVAGPVANFDLMSVKPGYDQISFHTPRACAILYNAII